MFYYIKKIKKHSLKIFNEFHNSNNAQLSLELFLILLISIMIFVSITIPLANFGFDFAFDSSNSLEIKSELSKIANGIDMVYSNGAGSKRSISINSPSNVDIKFTNNPNFDGGLAIVDYVLNDGTLKRIEVNYKCSSLNQNLHISEGYNLIIVEWPVGSENIIIYKG